jgi:hypothetical protein
MVFKEICGEDENVTELALDSFCEHGDGNVWFHKRNCGFQIRKHMEWAKAYFKIIFIAFFV